MHASRLSLSMFIVILATLAVVTAPRAQNATGRAVHACVVAKAACNQLVESALARIALHQCGGYKGCHDEQKALIDLNLKCYLDQRDCVRAANGQKPIPRE